MPTTKVIKPKLVEAARKTIEKAKPAKVKAAPSAPAVRNSRASSCPRCPQRDRADRATAGAQGASSKTRARSSSAAPKPTEHWSRSNPDHHGAAGSAKCRETTACPVPRDQRSIRAASQSHKAFTVIPPDPKKRREIQRKAEAELAALEELRLSRAMAYVSINPSSVGGCMSLEEVRSKQQQEMMQAKRKHKPMKKQVMEQTSVLTS